jgi:hypothetical protein
MEDWGFAVLVVVVLVGAFVATRLIGRSARNEGGDHGGGYSSSVD